MPRERTIQVLERQHKSIGWRSPSNGAGEVVRMLLTFRLLAAEIDPKRPDVLTCSPSAKFHQ